MSLMRMEIEMVQMLHRQLQLSINEMEDSMDSLLRARSQLDASWRVAARIRSSFRLIHAAHRWVESSFNSPH